MFTYTFRNKLFLGQYRRIVLSFPLPREWEIEMESEGWYVWEFPVDDWVEDSWKSR